MCLAAPAKVISITDNEAVVDCNGVRTTTRLDTLTEPLAPGDYVLIHTGFAIRRLSARDGEETLKLFDELADSLRESAGSSDDANSLRESEEGSDEANPHQHTDADSLENASRSPVEDHSRVDDAANPLRDNLVGSDENARRSRVNEHEQVSSESES